jgi:hypothetical protein
MKTIQLTPKEFVLFTILANHAHIIFMYWISQGTVHVEADMLSLSELGY